MTDIESDPRSLFNTSPNSDTSCSTTLSMADRLETMYNTNSPPLALDCPPPKKRKVNFSLTLDIKQETDDACVPQGVEVSDVDSYYSDLPTLPTTSPAHTALRSRPSLPAQTSRWARHSGPPTAYGMTRPDSLACIGTPGSGRALRWWPGLTGLLASFSSSQTLWPH